jgi:hypothetical protein
MVKRATGSRETTGAGGAEVRRTYRHGLLTSLTDEFKNESNTFTRLQKRRETDTGLVYYKDLPSARSS